MFLNCRSQYCYVLFTTALAWTGILGAAILVAAGCKKESDNGKPEITNKKENSNAEAQKDQFEFVYHAEDSGIIGSCKTGGESGLRTMLETLGGGVGVVDFDMDGLTDVFFNGGGTLTSEKEVQGARSFLFRNLGQLKFKDQTVESGIDSTNLYNHACQFGDIDNDGFVDAVITGFQGILVFRNLGDGSFERINCGIQTDKWATSAALSDFDNDGNLDLFVCNYLDWSFANHRMCNGTNGKPDVCSPRLFEGVVDDLFTSNGDWTFQKDGGAKGINASGKGLGVVTGDIDMDGDVDIYVACDVTNNLLYINKGNGTFDEKGAPSGADTGEHSMPNGSMGTDLGDFNNDGLPDIGVANFESEDFALYKQVRIGGENKGSFIFNNASKKSRLTAIDQMYVGWGTLFADLDSDGDEDLIVNNGHISYHPSHGTMKQKPLLFANDGNVFRFKNVTKSEYFETGHHGRGVVAADFDLDGDLDLAFANCNENFALLENKSKQQTQLTRIKVIGIESNRDGIGIVLRSHEKSVRMCKGGGSFLSSLEQSFWVNGANAKEDFDSNWVVSESQPINSSNQSIVIVVPPTSNN